MNIIYEKICTDTCTCSWEEYVCAMYNTGQDIVLYIYY